MLAKATCPVCLREIAVSQNGRLRQHKSEKARGFTCQGSGAPPLGPWHPDHQHGTIPAAAK